MKNENEKIPTQIPPFQYSYSEMHHQEDEIDLYELWKTLWQGRWKVFFISIIIFLVAFGYTLSVNPTYQAQVFFLPPSAEDIRELIILDHPAKKEPTGSPEEIYQTFQKNLQNRHLRLEFFRAHQLFSRLQSLSNIDDIEEPHAFEMLFNQKLKFSFPKKKDNNLASLTFELENQKLSADWLNSYVNFIVSRTRQQLVETSKSELHSRKKLFLSEIESLRKTATNQRIDRITILQESLLIAKLSNITDPASSRGRIDMEYMRGSRAIESEINVLQNRKDEDPFIKGLRDLQAKIAYLETLSVKEKNIRPVIVDQIASIPSHPIKPKKKLILTIALLLGIMIGILFVLIQSFLDKKKSKTE